MKFGMFAFIFTLLNFMTFYVVDGEGAGGDEQGGDNAGTENTDVGNTNIDNSENANEGETALTADEIKSAKQIIADNRQKETISAVEKEIKTRVPDFDASKVVESLRELNKTDPARAAYYNASPAAWEMYHKEHIANVAKGDAVNFGSHSGSGNDFGSVLEKARGGDKKSSKAALEMSKA